MHTYHKGCFFYLLQQKSWPLVSAPSIPSLSTVVSEYLVWWHEGDVLDANTKVYGDGSNLRFYLGWISLTVIREPRWTNKYCDSTPFYFIQVYHLLVFFEASRCLDALRAKKLERELTNSQTHKCVWNLEAYRRRLQQAGTKPKTQTVKSGEPLDIEQWKWTIRKKNNT